MNQDARNKLRGMGGIMASSPKLMQVAQGYQISGPVMPPPRMPMSDSLTVPGIGAPVLGLGRVPPMPPQMPTAGVGSLGEEAGVTVDDLLEGSGATAFSLPETAGPAVSGPSPSDIIKRQNDLRRRRGLPPLSPGAEQEFLKSAAEAPLPQDVAAAEAAQAELAAIEERKVGGVPASSADAERERQLREEIGETGRRMGETLEAEDVAMSMPLQPKRLTQEQIDKATELARKDPNFVAPGTQEEPAPDTGTGDDGTGGPSGGGTGGPAPAPTKRDLRSRYKEKIELFKEIYGEDDEDRARDKAMSLAMLGLAIAAGQSPNALTNIAQGAMVGLQGMSEQEQARREREQGLRTLALETAIAEQGAETEAEREAAASRLEFEREKILEGIKAGGSGKSGYENVPRVAEQAVTIEDQILKGISEGTIAVPEQYRDNQQAFITNEKNKRVLEYIDTLGLEGQIPDAQTRGQLGQQFMYKDVDPEDPQAGRFPVVRSARELSFILPGQDYLRYNPSTGKYTRETKPVSE